MYHIALGIMYLHSQNIVHGDLKGVLNLSIVHYLYLIRNYHQQNVLIDDSGKALLCDFGLSRVKADITSRTTTSDATTVAGSRYWMAPERLMGKPLRNPGDIYAFGMTSYEVG
jgi:serine/threonine protein kinase